MRSVPAAPEPPEVVQGRDIHINALLIARRALDALEQLCRDEGITHAQYVVLWTLCLADDPDVGMPVGAVADGLLNKASDATRLVDRLERDGLVERVRNPEDRRGVLVRSTEAGRAAFARVTPKVQAFHAQQWSGLSPAEIVDLGRLLNRALWGNGQTADGSDGSAGTADGSDGSAGTADGSDGSDPSDGSTGTADG